MKTIVERIPENDCDIRPAGNPNRMRSPNTSAIVILESGPAAATMASPQRWFRRLYGLYGTGFAQPMINPPKK